MTQIEKLTDPMEKKMKDGSFSHPELTAHDMMDKINEIVDFCNKQQECNLWFKGLHEKCNKAVNSIHQLIESLSP